MVDCEYAMRRQISPMIPQMQSLRSRDTWRGVRVADGVGLENRCASQHRGFDSLSLRSMRSCGETGRHDGFRFHCRKVCRFKSCREHSHIRSMHQNLGAHCPCAECAEVLRFLIKNRNKRDDECNDLTFCTIPTVWSAVGQASYV